MPIIRDFVYQEDDDTGLLGLLPTWMPNANTTTAIAHDVLEHFGSTQLSPVEDELVALGALLALRIENGVFNSRLSDVDQLAAVVASTLTDIDRDDLDPPRPCATRPLSDLFDCAEEVIQAASTKALEMARRELEDYSNTPFTHDAVELRETVVGYLRRGYRKAMKRFEDCDLYTVGHSLFQRLNKASEELVRSEMLQVGDRVRVLVDARRSAVSFKVNGQPAEAYFG